MLRFVVLTLSLLSAPVLCFAAASLSLETRVGLATEWCTDPEFPSDCSLPPSDNTLIDPGEDLAIGYLVENTGDVQLDTHTLVDSELGTILAGVSYSLAPGASIYLTQRQTAPLSPATYPRGATWTAEFGGSGSVAANDAYVYTVVAPTLMLDVTISPAADVCSDPSDTGTCSLPATGLATFRPGLKMAIGYSVTNNGPTTFALHDLVDDAFGVILGSFSYSLAPGNSIYLVQIETPSGPYVRSAAWSGTTGGGYVAMSSDIYQLRDFVVFIDGFE